MQVGKLRDVGHNRNQHHIRERNHRAGVYHRIALETEPRDEHEKGEFAILFHTLEHDSETHDIVVNVSGDTDYAHTAEHLEKRRVKPVLAHIFRMELTVASADKAHTRAENRVRNELFPRLFVKVESARRYVAVSARFDSVHEARNNAFDKVEFDKANHKRSKDCNAPYSCLRFAVGRF